MSAWKLRRFDEVEPSEATSQLTLAVRRSLQPNGLALLHFVPAPGSSEAVPAWVEVVELRGDRYVGKTQDPVPGTDLAEGAEVAFGPEHVVARTPFVLDESRPEEFLASFGWLTRNAMVAHRVAAGETPPRFGSVFETDDDGALGWAILGALPDGRPDRTDELEWMPGKDVGARWPAFFEVACAARPLTQITWFAEERRWVSRKLS